MSKLSNLIYMIKLLQSGRKYTINELSKTLEVTPRMIRVYKDELEKAGIYIDSISGIYGGYLLNNKLTTINVGCTIQDINVLKLADDVLKVNKDFTFYKEYNNAINKIENAYFNTENMIRPKVPYIQNYLNQKDTENEVRKYNKLNYAINKSFKVKIVFASVNSLITERIIHPCELFVYNDSWYVIAFCELRQEVRHFRLSSIMKFEVLNESFQKVL